MAPEEHVGGESTARAGRNESGHWLPGVSGNPAGPPRKRTLTQALRELTDPDEMAALLLKRARRADPRWLQALVYVFDRLEGKPKQAVDVKTEHSDAWYELQREIHGALTKDDDTTKPEPE